MRTAMVIGATGLVGGHLVETLKTSVYEKVIVISRRPVKYDHPKIEVRVIDFDNPDKELIKCDDLFCAIGTTLKKAGSKENQYRIDCEYPSTLASLAKQNGARKFVLVSSIGANPDSSNFYLRTKGDLEERLRKLNFQTLIITRPSFILGDRSEFRLGEKIGIVIAKFLNPLMFGPLKKYRGKQATSIAERMVAEALKDQKGEIVLESDKI